MLCFLCGDYSKHSRLKRDTRAILQCVQCGTYCFFRQLSQRQSHQLLRMFVFLLHHVSNIYVMQHPRILSSFLFKSLTSISTSKFGIELFENSIVRSRRPAKMRTQSEISIAGWKEPSRTSLDRMMDVFSYNIGQSAMVS